MASPQTSPREIKKRHRFDSASTTSSSCEQLDSRFEVKTVFETPEVKKSFLTSKQNSSSALNSSSPSSSSSALPTSMSTLKYQVILCLLPNSSEQVISSEIEMLIDFDIPLCEAIYDIIEQLNEKLKATHSGRFSASKNNSELLKISADSFLKNYFEISEASKGGLPKGCSFDMKRSLREIKCKSRLSLKVLNKDAFHSQLSYLLQNKGSPIKSFDLSFHPIQETEDDTLSASPKFASSYYRNSLVAKEMEGTSTSRPFLLDDPAKPSSNTRLGLLQTQPQQSQQQKQQQLPIQQEPAMQKKASLWSRFFNCV